MLEYDGQNKFPNMDYLINQYGTSLLRMAAVFLGDAHLAQDAVQETYIKAYYNFHTFQGGSSEKTWLMRIAINTCKDMMKSAWRRRVVLKQPQEMWEFTANNDYRQSDYDDLIEAIKRLPPILKEVVLLFYYQDLSVSDISIILKIKQSTVRVRLNRARAKLKQFLTEGGSIYEYEHNKASN